MRPVTMELRGRLGNQLFCWATAQAVSIERGVEIVFSGRFAHSEMDVLAFDTEINIVDPGRILLAYQRSRALRSIRDATGWRAVIQESGHGFDPAVLLVRAGQTLRGHFQSPRYFHAHRSQITSMLASLKQPSLAFRRIYAEIASNDWIAVQVRGGDYFDHLDKFLIPGADYYSSALALARSTGLSQVVVFTDDLQHAQRLVPDAEMFIVGGVDLSPAECLVLSKCASALVGANSTFSWWTGYLMEESVQKIFPKKWFRASALTEADLFPEDFFLLDS